MGLGLISLSLLSFVSACGSVRYVTVAPEAYLLADCVKRTVTLETNGDLAVAYVTRDQDVDICNADKAALREFYATGAD